CSRTPLNCSSSRSDCRNLSRWCNSGPYGSPWAVVARAQSASGRARMACNESSYKRFDQWGRLDCSWSRYSMAFGRDRAAMMRPLGGRFLSELDDLGLDERKESRRSRGRDVRVDCLRVPLAPIQDRLKQALLVFGKVFRHAAVAQGQGGGGSVLGNHRPK